MRFFLTIACSVLAAGLASAASLDIDGNPLGPGGSVRPSIDPSPTGPGVMTFNDQGDFLAAAGPVTTEDFEDEPVVGSCASGGQVALSFDHFDAAASLPALKVLDTDCGNGNHNTTPGGTKQLSADTDLGGVSADVTFSFNTSVHAFGLFLIDAEGGSTQITINGNSYLVPPTGNGGQAYFGILSDVAITTVDFAIVDGSDSHYSFDDVAYGAGPVSVDAVSWSSVKGRYQVR